MISLDKNYRTKDGKEVRLYAIDGRGSNPVHGAILGGNGWLSSVWSESGKFAYANQDLIEVVMIPEYWVVFESDGIVSHVTHSDPFNRMDCLQFAIHHPAQEKPHV